MHVGSTRCEEWRTFETNALYHFRPSTIYPEALGSLIRGRLQLYGFPPMQVEGKTDRASLTGWSAAVIHVNLPRSFLATYVLHCRCQRICIHDWANGNARPTLMTIIVSVINTDKHLLAIRGLRKLL